MFREPEAAVAPAFRVLREVERVVKRGGDCPTLDDWREIQNRERRKDRVRQPARTIAVATAVTSAACTSFPKMEIANVFTVECAVEMEHDDFRIAEAQLGPPLGAELIGGSVYEIAPGKKLWPYHLHHANEEWLVVVRGRPTLRTPEGERELVEGDVACFPRGATGAHQVRNMTEEPVRILMISTLIVPEILEYPDSGKLDTLSAKGERILLTRHAEPAKYWDGES
jgi:uncharacterized cupin superfamily protein